MKLPARLLFLVFFIFHFSFFIFATPAFAQTNPGLTANTNPDVPKNLHNWTQNVMIETMAAMICQLTGIDPVNPNQQCLGVDAKTGQIGFVEGGGGAIGVMGHMIAMTYTPPLRTGDYFGYLAQNFGIAKSAYAQEGRTGTGFDSLKPLLELWVAFRNIVYMLFVIIFIVLGFGIMLRINIDPRTVMTIANQLPKIIVAILLVTFSFAIAGFMIDLMWASIYITYNVFEGPAKEKKIDISYLNPTGMAGRMVFDAVSGWGTSWTIAHDIALDGRKTALSLLGINETLSITNPLDMIEYTKGSFSFVPFEFKAPKIEYKPGSLTDFFDQRKSGKSTIDWFVDLLSGVGAVGTWWFMKSLGDFPLAGALALPFGIPAGFLGTEFALRSVIPYLLFFIVVFIALVTALFRIWFSLIMAYIAILIDVLFAPFWIVAGLIPGSPIGFGAWFRNLIANLSAFPVTIGMFLLGNILVETFKQDRTDLFVPPLIGNTGLTNFFPAIIGLAIILMTPRALAMVKDIIKSPEFKHSEAVGQAIGTGLKVLDAPEHAKSLAMLGYYRGYARQIPLIGKYLGRPGDTTEPGK